MSQRVRIVVVMTCVAFFTFGAFNWFCALYLRRLFPSTMGTILGVIFIGLTIGLWRLRAWGRMGALIGLGYGILSAAGMAMVLGEDPAISAREFFLIVSLIVIPAILLGSWCLDVIRKSRHEFYPLPVARQQPGELLDK